METILSGVAAAAAVGSPQKRLKSKKKSEGQAIIAKHETKETCSPEYIYDDESKHHNKIEEEEEEEEEELYPKHQRPLPSECWAARDYLASRFGDPQREHHLEVKRKMEAAILKPEQIREGDGDCPLACGRFRKSVLDSVVGTILSQNTTDLTSARAMRKLKSAYPTWDEVLEARAEDIEECIKEGGLSKTKTERIQNILQTVKAERGACTMDYLYDYSTQEVKRELARFKGVGPKTISCVLMFCLQRPEFPVDTHVWKIAKALKWIPPSAGREEAYYHLNRRVPDDCKYDLHVLLVDYGKKTKNDVRDLRDGMNSILRNVNISPTKDNVMYDSDEKNLDEALRDSGMALQTPDILNEGHKDYHKRDDNDSTKSNSKSKRIVSRTKAQPIMSSTKVKQEIQVKIEKLEDDEKKPLRFTSGTSERCSRKRKQIV